MADAVATNVIQSGNNTWIAELINLSDGTGESAVVKVDRSSLTDLHGRTPTNLSIDYVNWSVQAFGYVTIGWSKAVGSNVAMHLANGWGHKDFAKVGSLINPDHGDGEGDIVVTAPAGASGATYSITLVVRLRTG